MARNVEENISCCQKLLRELAPVIHPQPPVAGLVGLPSDPLAVLAETFEAEGVTSTIVKSLVRKALNLAEKCTVCGMTFGRNSLGGEGVVTNQIKKHNSSIRFDVSFVPEERKIVLQKFQILCFRCSDISDLVPLLSSSSQSLLGGAEAARCATKLNESLSHFLKVNGHELDDSLKLQHAISVAFSLHLFCRELRWKFAKPSCSFASFLGLGESGSLLSSRKKRPKNQASV